MKLSTLMTVKAAVCLVVGVLLVFIPSIFLNILGINLDTGGVLMARLYGAATFGNLFLTWGARKDSGSITLKASVLGQFVYDAVGFIVTFIAVLTGILNVLGWAIVALYLLLAIGYGYFQFLEPRHRAEPAFPQ